MEAVPRLPMIGFNLKGCPDCPTTDFGRLKQYIRDFYHEDPDSYSGEIHKLEALRASAVHPAIDVTGCSVLKKYYCQLHFLQSRFPMGKDGAAAVNFSWKGVYSNGVITLDEIRFEIVSVLYNIGALHSQLGANDGRSSSEGLKLACTHFQCAAWAFQHIKDTYPPAVGIDLSSDLMQFKYNVSLAQAQECILEKSMTDNRKATINAKVAAQIVDYYNMALNVLHRGGAEEEMVVDTIGIKLFKSWTRYVRFKLTYYGCIALLYQGMQSEEQQKMGERLAYYQAAFDKLVETTKLTKGLDNRELIDEALTFTMDVVEGKRKAAKNENEFIYHEEVPDKDALPEIKGAALVKGIGFSVTDLEISGPDIFGRLVPMKAHEASSLYSEEKAKVLRRVGALVEEKDQELVGFLSSLQLECVNAHQEPDTLPQDIVDRCAALSVKPDAIQNLIESMDKLSDIYHDVEAMLNEIMELINNEEVEEKEYQEVMGSRPPSIVATDLTREAKKYEEAHHKAAESNNTLHKAMTQHIANLRLLELPLAQLARQIPSISALNYQQPIVKEMQHLVAKVEEMRCQRETLATQLRESVCSDDITAQLVVRQKDNLEKVFQEELQKHSKYVTFIEHNLAAQDNIIKALTEAYAQYAPVRKATMELMRQRNLTISALMSSYDAYEDLIAKSSKGQEFYRKLETNVTKLLQRVKGTCKVQQEERDSILAKNCKTMPSKTKQTASPEVTTSVSTGGPKLKDYLDNYKKDKSTNYVKNNPGNVTNDPYYNSGNLTSPSTKPWGYDGVNSAYDSSQPWLPSVRPAPVGQEGTCPSTTTADPKTEQSYSSNYSGYAANKPYASDSTQYPQQYADQYAAYMSQYQNYPSSSSPYHTQPANFIKNDISAFSKVPNTSNVVNYPPNVPSPQPSLSSNTSYPSPAPSPASQNYPQPTGEQYKVQNATPQGYNVPTSLPLGYTATPNNATQQYYNPNYPTNPTQSMVYHQQTKQNNESYSGNLQANQEYSSNNSLQTYQTQNIPQSATLNASPLHNYAGTNTVPQPSNFQTPTFDKGSSYYAVPAYQTPTTTYSQPSQTQQGALGSDQIIPNYYNTLDNKWSNANAQNLTNQPTNIPSQTNLQTGVQQSYNQYPNVPTTNYSYSASSANPGVSQSGSVQANHQSQPYSSYTPQMYTSYNNSEQSTGVQPWQTSYDTKNPQQNLQNFYGANQYPNYSQVGSEMQYTPATGASFYTHAGQATSYQTSASTQQVFSQVSQPNYTQGNYFQQQYGYQYTSASCESPSESPRVFPGQAAPQGSVTPQSPMTYMLASNSNLKVTFSQDSSKGTQNTPTESSNVDLLSGLDFSVGQDPLVPQQKDTGSPAKSTNIPAAFISNGIEDKLAAVTLAETLPAVTLSPVSVPSTPKKSVDVSSCEKFQLKDPFNDQDVLNQFAQEVEKFEKFVEGLTVKTLNGPTPLDIKWKELLELQEKDTVKHSISVARCYPVKNRFPDILPYDNSRVELPSTKDDYINASYVKDVTANFPDSIVTQLPLPSTFGDFWTMVLEQQVELVVCLLNDHEVEGSVYWPVEKGVEMEVGRVKLTLQSSNACKHWVERIIYVTDTRLSRVVVHLQFTEWPGSLFPSSPGPFLSLVSEALSLRAQQRGGGPVVVHCLSGVGRGGLFLLLAAAVCYVHSARAPFLPDLTMLAASVSACRKNALRDREHFKFAYQALLYYAQDLLMKRGILASRSSFEEKRTKSHTRHPSEDFLLGPPKDVPPQSSSDTKPSGESSVDGAEKAADPLSQLDPLWSLKRLK